jgi:hypothetical protein
MRTPGVFLTAFLAASLALSAQQPAPTPTSPYVEALPARGHWRVDFTWKSPTPGAAPASNGAATQLQTIDVVKTGPLMRVTLTFSDGTTQQFDSDGDAMLDHTASGWHRVGLSTVGPVYPYSPAGFSLVNWVGPGSFKDVVKYGQVVCFHYATSHAEAWIAADSRQPVAARQGDAQVTYQFLSPPDSPLTGPPEEEALIRAIDHPVPESP